MRANRNILRWMLLLVVAICFVKNYSGIFDPKLDQNGDNFAYLFLGKNLADGNGYSMSFLPEKTPHLHFPPGYPVFVSMILRVLPDNISAVKVCNGLLLLLSLCILFRIIRKSSRKYGLLLAFLSTLLCAMNPTLLRWATIMMSEMLYMSLSLGIIAICMELEPEKLKHKDAKQIVLTVLLVLLVAATYFVRTMGITVIIAALISIIVLSIKAFIKNREDRNSWLAPLAVAALIAISLFIAKKSWDARNNSIVPNYAGSYTANFLNKSASDEKMTTLEDWSERVGINLSSFITCYIPNTLYNPEKATVIFYLDIKPTAWNWIVGVITILIMLFGLMYFSSVRVILLLYLLATFGVLMLYQEQYAGLRYMVPVIPIIVFAFIAGVVAVFSLLSEKLLRIKPEYVVVIASILTTSVLAFVFVRDQETAKLVASVKSEMKYSDDNAYKQYIMASIFFRNAPKDYIVACRKPEVFYYFSSYHYCVRIPFRATEEEVMEFFIKNKVNAVIIDNWMPHAYSTIYPAICKYHYMFRLIGQFGNPESPTMVYVFDGDSSLPDPRASS